MNIYCIIFMCTFGSNNTETDVSSLDSTKLNKTDATLMILPERGEPVPDVVDIVMDLPLNNSASSTHIPSSPKTKPTSTSSSASNGEGRSPTLSEILLPPSRFAKPI